jgi:EAL domain-containing protein (putative c-di-GMP-specific phosphodiesterase class I)
VDAPEPAASPHRVRASAVGVRGRDYSFAFQPIVDSVAQRVYSYEALIRGPRNEAAPRVLGRIPASRMHQFDEEARQVAIELAAQLEIDCLLNLNFLPRSLEISRSTVESTLETAARCGIGPGRIILEVSESEVIDDHEQFAHLIEEYRRVGLRLAIDDFGAGNSGLNLLADFQPDMIKIDMNLVRGIETRGPRQAIMRAIIQVCRELAIEVAAEGVETLEEYHWFRGEGVHLFQGYLFAMPGFESLPEVRYPARG